MIEVAGMKRQTLRRREIETFAASHIRGAASIFKFSAR
jgi:hypothetical protein